MKITAFFLAMFVISRAVLAQELPKENLTAKDDPKPLYAAIFLEKMNTLYIGENNPVRISAGTVPRENVHVSFTNGDIVHRDGDEYEAVPTVPGKGKIIVAVMGKATEFPVLVKYLPDPKPLIGTHEGGAVPSDEFKALGGLIAKLQDNEFQSPFMVVSYKLTGFGGAIKTLKTAGNEGARWTGEAANIVNQASPGSVIIFDEIQVKGKDGKIRTLPTIACILK